METLENLKKMYVINLIFFLSRFFLSKFFHEQSQFTDRWGRGRFSL